jgi:hypothetical protein
MAVLAEISHQPLLIAPMMNRYFREQVWVLGNIKIKFRLRIGFLLQLNLKF